MHSTSGLKQEGRKKVKLRARKLHNAANNNNVFRAVRFTCATAWKSERSQKSTCSAFPNIAQLQKAYNLWHSVVQEVPFAILEAKIRDICHLDITD